MSEDTKNTQTALKEALVLFEASFVQYTKKPTQGNIDELISAGQTYKELWIMAISDGSMAGNIEKLNKTLALSSRKLDYEKSDEINTKLENLDATQEEHEATLKKAVDDSFDTSDTDGKWSLKQVSAIQRRDRAERLQGHFSGNDLYRRTISANESRLGLSNFSDESLELLPFKSLKNIQDNAVIQKTISATATIATSRNRIPKMIASNVRKATNSKYETVPINLITPSKLKDGGLGFDEDSPESIKVLMKNISEFGIKEPIHVYSNASIETKSNGEFLYKVLDGDRRLEAARILGYKEIPVAINSIGVVSEHEFISHNISARGYRESGKPYTRRWYYEQPSPSTLLTWRDQVKSHDNEQSRALLDVIDKDIAINETYSSANDQKGTKKLTSLREAWWINRDEFEDIIERAFLSNQFDYHNNEKRFGYPHKEIIISDQLSKDEKLSYLNTFTLPHERYQFNYPHAYFAFQDSIYQKYNNDLIEMPFKKINENTQRVWRDVVMYTPNSVTIRSATTNLAYKNGTAIPDNSNWVISNDMPSLNNQTIKAFIKQIRPDVAKNISKKDRLKMEKNFKDA